MEYLKPAIEMIVLIINIFSIFVLGIGVILCAKNLFLIKLSKCSSSEKTTKIQYVRTELGSYVLLGLEILIIADIIETIIYPTFTDIVGLAAIVAIRTVISIFLNKEIQEIRDLENIDSKYEI